MKVKTAKHRNHNSVTTNNNVHPANKNTNRSLQNGAESVALPSALLPRLPLSLGHAASVRDPHRPWEAAVDVAVVSKKENTLL